MNNWIIVLTTVSAKIFEAKKEEKDLRLIHELFMSIKRLKILTTLRKKLLLNAIILNTM